MARRVSASGAIAALLLLACAHFVFAHEGNFLDSAFTKPTRVNSTSIEPYANENPIGLAVVPRTKGKLFEGDVLVSNYADESGAPGTGYTVTRIDKNGMASTFVAVPYPPKGCGSATGFTAGICATSSGHVVVTSTPAVNGSYSTEEPGCLMVFSYEGELVTTLFGNHIRGPWELACTEDLATNRLYLFIATGLPDIYNPPFDANAAGLNSNSQWQMYQQQSSRAGLKQSGSVVKMVLTAPPHGTMQLVSTSYIANNFFWSNVDEMQLGPGGLAVIGRDLYISEPFTDSIWVSWGAAASPDANEGPQLLCNKIMPQTRACPDLDNPLGLAAGPQGQLLVVNGGNTSVVEIHDGRQVSSKFIDLAGVGASFLMYDIVVAPEDNQGGESRTYLSGIASDTLLELGRPTVSDTSGAPGNNIAGRR